MNLWELPDDRLKEEHQDAVTLANSDKLNEHRWRAQALADGLDEERRRRKAVTFIAIIAGYWGRGYSMEDALERLSRHAGRDVVIKAITDEAITIHRFEGDMFPTVDDFGMLHWHIAAKHTNLTEQDGDNTYLDLREWVEFGE